MTNSVKQMMQAGLVIAALGFSAFASAQPLPTERLYKGAAPGSEKWKVAEEKRETADGVSFTNVRDPDFTAYLPDPAKANGAAVVYLSGGALRSVSFGKELNELVARFNARGVAVIALKYRTLQMDPSAPRGGGPGGPAVFQQKLEIKNGNANPSPNDPAHTEVIRFATDDARAMMRIVRARAAHWKIDPHKVGMFGTSAGGAPAFGAMMTGDPATAPNFIIANFAPALQDVAAGPNAPPLFIVVEAPHGAVTEGLVQLYPIWKAAGRPVELHVYDVKNFTMSPALWGDRMMQWLEEQKFIPPAK